MLGDMSISNQMLHEGSYKYTSAPNGQRQQDVEILPSVCLAFSPVTNDVVVNLLRRKIGNKLLRECFLGWKNTCGNVSQKIRLTFEEVFANYVVTHEYDGIQSGTNEEKQPVATMTKDSTGFERKVKTGRRSKESLASSCYRIL